jgi:GWxTD domain-containing protein
MKKMIAMSSILFISLVCFMSCTAKKIITKPYEDDFFEKTQIIMSKTEIQIYKHLPDQVSRDEFVEDFWGKRDPSEGTGENENRIEFEHRIDYVDRFFKETTGKGRGWESDRGKVYVLLGEPDEKNTSQVEVVDRFGIPKRLLREVWVYYYYKLYLEFVDYDEFGVYRLNTWPVELLTAIERAKFSITQKGNMNFMPEFKAKFEHNNNTMTIRIPSHKIAFADKGDKMDARFTITMYVYRDYKKSGKVSVTRQVNESKENLLNKKFIELTVPYTLPGKGHYNFDVIVKDVNSGFSYRDMVGYKF